MRPSGVITRPVAATMTSAAISSPEFIRTPPGVKRSIPPVTIETRPLRIAFKKSPAGAMQSRWSHGS